MRRFVISTLLTLLFLFIPFVSVFAQNVNKPLPQGEAFSTDYDVAFDVGEDGITEVTQKISLKNLTTQYFASKYTLSIGSTTLSDITASDSQGALQTKVEQKGTKTEVEIKFNQQVAGEGKVQVFTLKFKSKDFAQHLGKVWEVNLPKIPSTGNVQSYNLVLSVPLTFGDPTSISPNPRSQSSTFNRLFLTFHKDQLEKSGISANFGTNQVFDFTLKYNLENKSLFPVISSVALPPDTEYQQVVLNRISPQPENVTVDADGNYLAWFKLPRGTKQQVLVNGSAKLYIIPRKDFQPVITEKQVQELTKADSFWEKDNPQIKTKLAEIFASGVPQTNREKARLIYRYVVDTLQYDTSRLTPDINRFGAVTALNNPTTSVCMEFTDLFIALSRAANVPTRELDGYGFSQNQTLRPLSLIKESMHAWPEYFDEQRGWVMVDPTWESTSGGVDYFNKFDLNHFVLVKKGISSELPVPADDVNVEVSQVDFVGKPQLDVSIGGPSALWAGLPYQLTIKVTNLGNLAAFPGPLSVTTGDIVLLGKTSTRIDVIPAFGSVSYPINVRTTSLLKSFDDVIEVTLGDKKYHKEVTVKPLYLFNAFPAVLIGVGALIGLLYGAILGWHIYHKRLRKKKKV